MQQIVYMAALSHTNGDATWGSVSHPRNFLHEDGKNQQSSTYWTIWSTSWASATPRRGKKTSERTQTEMPYFYHALGLTDPKYFQPISLYVLRLKQYIAWWSYKKKSPYILSGNEGHNVCFNIILCRLAYNFEFKKRKEKESSHSVLNVQWM